MICDLTDHLPIFLFLNTPSWTSDNVTRYARDYSTLLQEDLPFDVQTIQSETNEDDINQIFYSFVSVMTTTIENMLLSKSKKVKKKLNFSPDRGIRQFIKTIRNVSSKSL